MGYIFDFHDARAYARWIDQMQHHGTAALETELMLKLLKPSRGESVLNIGCGTGSSMLPLLDMGLNVTGIDPSPYMLDISHGNVGQRVDLYRGIAEDLPFDDNSFNHAFFFISLEFVDDPEAALAEACRVAKDKVFIGFLNRQALKGIQLRVKRLFTPSIYNRARFFSIWELKRMMRGIAGKVPMSWRTVCQLPPLSGGMMRSFEQSAIVQHCPFGTFAGLVATLVPRVRTRPLAIKYTAPQGRALVAGSAPVRPAAADADKKIVPSQRAAAKSKIATG